MKKTLLVALVAIFSLNASAQTNHEKTLQLFKLMGIEKNINAMTENMKVVIAQTTAKTNPKKAQEMSTLFTSEMKILMPKLIVDMVPLYEKHFSGAELDKYIEFYSTPAGQKLVNSAPILQKEMMTTMITKYLPEMQKRILSKMQADKGKK